jgi:hypothetical protein
MDTLRILMGAVVLILGRKLYWLFVAVVGFVLGMALAPRFISGGSQWVILVIALAAGGLGALLAVFLQQTALAVAGFIGGGYVGYVLAGMMGWEAGRLLWVPALIGAIVGVVLVVALFEWALIILSSLIGAGLIIEATRLSTTTAGLLFVALLIVGIAIQAGMMRGDRQRSEPGPPAQSDD